MHQAVVIRRMHLWGFKTDMSKRFGKEFGYRWLLQDHVTSQQSYRSLSIRFLFRVRVRGNLRRRVMT